MTPRDKETLKSYFNTGDVPTEQNYADLIDSISDGSHTHPQYATLIISRDEPTAQAGYIWVDPD